MKGSYFFDTRSRPSFPPELHVESWLESIEKIRAIDPAKLYLPHFGKVEGSVAAHLDAVEERVRRWSNWFLDRLRAGEDEAQLISAFAEYEAGDLRARDATDEEVRDYEAADPSYMAVSAALRYWRKYHPQDEPRNFRVPIPQFARRATFDDDVCVVGMHVQHLA